ncbi:MULTISPECIES: capsular polysaccharide biosynthesis protein [unclassified Cobetia]|uniref:capsular polysaccharide biosynthesis protein n=1 Tax=unclassified Cobetia TaxID=2609414 RepID=UPI001CEFCA48|nr:MULTISPECIES: capsular polysaccharide biosynthesis protein [unclassified Cobetia]MDH2446959.1 capsular polysaccharide biosynthesis protein [Cobetia sp. 2AS]
MLKAAMNQGWGLIMRALPCASHARHGSADVTHDATSGASLCFSSGIFRQPLLACFIPELLPLTRGPTPLLCQNNDNSLTFKNLSFAARRRAPTGTLSKKNVGKEQHPSASEADSLPELGASKGINTAPEFVGQTSSTNIMRVVGWGHKPTAKRARQYAFEHGLPYVALEDGFLRSLTLASAGYPGMAMVVDHQGIYYDARQPSDLEQLISEAPTRQAEALLARARAALESLRMHRLSKYNHAPERKLPARKPGMQRLLIVDQTAEDASVVGGMASPETFLAMLREACAIEGAEVWVKVHPDVIAGKKRGYLLEEARKLGCTLLSDDINPWCLFEQVDGVHVVTSQLGFEALMAGLPVTCHGMPFYAGWGLTVDRQQCPRRGESRTLEQVFAAAYLEYSRYANPYTQQAAALEEIIQLLADQKRMATRLAGHWQGLEFSGWKQKFIGYFLGPWSQLRFEKKPERALQRLSPQDTGSPPQRILSWAGRTPPERQAQVKEAGGELWMMEDGFLRSVGLGVDLTRPLSLVVDDKAMHFDASRASTLEEWLEHHEPSDAELARARRLRERIISLGLSKYNSQDDTLPDLRELAQDREIVLVVGQVESDASIRHACPGIRTNQALLEAARELHPEAYVIYKPHPDVVSGGRVGEVSQTPGTYDLELSKGNISDLFTQIDRLHTLCSLAGFEALIRGVPVTTHGLPFYAGWGLTEDQIDCPRRTRTLSVDALVAGALIEYPIYVDPDRGDLCNAETVVTILERQRTMLRNGTMRLSLPWKTRLYRGYRALFIGKH